MNDKFNDDDFSWLSNDDPEKKDDSSKEDDSFSWQQSDTSRPADQSGKRTGLTGQLSWQQGGDATGDDTGTTDDEGFAWQTDDQQGPAPSNRTGLTGTLSWQRDNQPEKTSADWMSDFLNTQDKVSDAEDEPAQQDDAPDWLKDAAPQASQPAAAPSSDTPSWLSGADDFDTPQEDDSFEAPSDTPDWLMGADDADDLYSEPQTSTPSAASDAPDWLTGFDDEEPAASQPTAIDTGASSFDSLFDDEPAETGDVPDWLSNFEPETPVPQAAPTPQSEQPALEDLFGDATDEQQWEASPWEAEAAPGEEEVPLEDLFPMDEQAADEDSERLTTDRFLSNLGLKKPTDSDRPPSPRDEPQFDDLFPLDEEEEPEEDGERLSTDRFLSNLGLSKPNEPQKSTTASASVDDFLADLGFDSEDGEPVIADKPVASAPPPSGSSDDDFDWFAAIPDEEAAPAASGDAPDWLSGLGDLETAFADEPAEQPAYQEMVDDDDPFAAFDEPAAAPEPVRSQYQDIDDLMSSFGDDEMDLPKTDELKLQGTDIDFDSFQDALGDMGRKTPQPRPEFSQESSDLLADLGITVGQVSASSIMRQQQDRPLEELSDRLQALRERSLESPASAAPAPKTSTSLSGVLPGVSETLPPATIQTGAPSIAGTVILDKEQQDRVARLRQLVGAGAQTTQQGDGDAPYADWAAEDLPAVSPKASAKPIVRPRRRFSLKIDRFLISLFLVAVVALPVVFDGARIGSLPAAQFAPNTPQLAVYDSINSLSAGDLVLVAVEYGPTAAGELDAMTDALLRHIIGRGAKPVIISRNAVGLLHAGNILNAIGGTPNNDYYIARYLTGDIVGLSAFAQNVTATLLTDVNGNPTGLNVASLDDFARIVVIVERAEDLRAWAEQIAPTTQTPLLAGTNFAASPLAEPYLDTGISGVRGLLVGAQDAYTYRAMLEGWTGQPIPTSAPDTETPTDEPLTGEATDEPTEVETSEAAETVTAEATEAATDETPEATNTPRPTSDESPTPRPTNTPDATNTPRPTSTPEPSPTVEAVPVFAYVNTGTTVNVRAEPDRNATAVGSARANEQVEIIGISDDGLWLNVRKSDGTEGWILAELLTIETAPAPKLNPMQRTIGGIDNHQEPETTPEDEPSDESTVEETSEVTETDEPTVVPTTRPTTAPPTAAPTVEPTTSASTVNETVTTQTSYDRQWYGTTLGLVFIVVVIALGNLVNLIRGLLRRSRAR
jgi:uncharacterized protein YgiM (DUF1202 family)